MGTIQWNDYFKTGIETVDLQHYRLVELANELGERVIENQIVYNDLEKLIMQLMDYTSYHFKDEERLMDEKSVDLRCVRVHKGQHHAFLKHIQHLSDNLNPDNRSDVNDLLAFLTRWLVFHILGWDQYLAEQIRAIEDQGLSPEAAFDALTERQSGGNEMLLDTLNDLFQQLSKRNLQLFELNRRLEEKVAERTEALRAANKRLENIALSDALTDLPNRRHAMEQLSVFWKAQESDRKPLSCLMIDADGFKQINDAHGHDAGDVVLKELSGALRNGVRTDDFVARLGGDEFFILCPNTPLRGAMTVADQLCSDVGRMRVSVGSGTWYGSISIGVATVTREMDTFEQLMKRADEGVYAAKNAGKGCVRSVQ